MERLVLHVALEVSERVAQRPWRRSRRSRRAPRSRIGRWKRPRDLLLPARAAAAACPASPASRVRAPAPAVPLRRAPASSPARTGGDSRGLHRALTRLRLTIGIREIGLGWRLQRLDVDPRLHEDESPIVALLLLLTKDFLSARFQFFGAGFEQVEIGTELEPDDDEDVDDHRQQHTIPPGEGAADDELILVPIVEVEVYQ